MIMIIMVIRFLSINYFGVNKQDSVVSSEVGALCFVTNYCNKHINTE